MPGHYGSMKMDMKKDMPKEKKGGMRKMSDKEKKLLKEHFEKHEPNASQSVKAKARMAVMRAGVDIKSMKGLHKLLGR